jgi:hypothetical protein
MPPETSFSSFLTSCHFLLHTIIIFIFSFSPLLFPHFLVSCVFSHIISLINLFYHSLTVFISHFPVTHHFWSPLSKYCPFLLNLFIYVIFPCRNFLLHLFPHYACLLPFAFLVFLFFAPISYSSPSPLVCSEVVLLSC